MQIVHRMSSPEKMKIFDLIRNGINHPEDIAEKMGITRQGVDKHLKEMYLFGIVDKYWVIGKKPRIVYNTTQIGEWLYKMFKEIEKEFIRKAEKEYKENLRSLDIKFINGEITKEDYLSSVEEEKKRFSWIFKKI